LLFGPAGVLQQAFFLGMIYNSSDYMGIALLSDQKLGQQLPSLILLKKIVSCGMLRNKFFI